MDNMSLIQQCELATRNFSVAWDAFTEEEKQEIGKELAKQYKRITNPFAKTELWRRVYQYRQVLDYIKPYF